METVAAGMVETRYPGGVWPGKSSRRGLLDGESVNKRSSVFDSVKHPHSFVRTLETRDFVSLESPEFLTEPVTHVFPLHYAHQLFNIFPDRICVRSGVFSQFGCQSITVKRLHPHSINHVDLGEDIFTICFIEEG